LQKQLIKVKKKNIKGYFLEIGINKTKDKDLKNLYVYLIGSCYNSYNYDNKKSRKYLSMVLLQINKIYIYLYYFRYIYLILGKLIKKKK